MTIDKPMLTLRALFCAWMVLMSGSCRSNQNKPVEDARAQLEAENARRAIATELEAGSSEAHIREFFKRHQWDFGFDEYQSRFSARVYRSSERTQTNVYIYVNQNKEFVRSDVQVHYTYF